MQYHIYAISLFSGLLSKLPRLFESKLSNRKTSVIACRCSVLKNIPVNCGQVSQIHPEEFSYIISEQAVAEWIRKWTSDSRKGYLAFETV